MLLNEHDVGDIILEGTVAIKFLLSIFVHDDSHGQTCKIQAHLHGVPQ